MLVSFTQPIKKFNHPWCQMLKMIKDENMESIKLILKKVCKSFDCHNLNTNKKGGNESKMWN